MNAFVRPSKCAPRWMGAAVLLVLAPVQSARCGLQDVLRAVHAEDIDALRRECARAPGELDDLAQDGRSPLVHALMAGRVDLAEVLLEAGAGPDLPTARGSSPLSFAALHAGLAGVELLLERGVDAAAGGKDTGSASKGAVFAGDVEVLERLVEAGAAPFDLAEWPVGDGPLLRCAQFGHGDMARYLLDRGCPLDRRDVHGRTALFLAAAHGWSDIVELLVERGADSGAKAFQDNAFRLMTPLQAAAYYGHLEIVEFLIGTGVDEALEPDGIPLRWANARGHDDVFAALAAASGRPDPKPLPAGAGGPAPGRRGFEVLGFSEAGGGGDGLSAVLARPRTKATAPVPGSPGAGARPRIGVVAAAGTVAVADVIAAALSADGRADLVERTELERAAQEQGLVLAFGGAGGDFGSFGDALGADGLVFLRPVELHTQTFIESRTIDVASGLVLDISYHADSGDAGAGEAVAASIAALIPKIGAPPGEAVALTMLGVRGLDIEPETRAAERAVAVALAHRVARTPGLYLLQREQMDRLTAEQALSGDASSFWRAGYLVEGNIEFGEGGSPGAGGDLTARLSLASAGGGDSVVVEARAARHDYTGLADSLVAEIAGAVAARGAAPVAWVPQDEAARLAFEAWWNIQAGAPGEAIAPADAAYALGRNDVTHAAVRVNARLEHFIARFEEWADAHDHKKLFMAARDLELVALGVRSLAEAAQIVAEQVRRDPAHSYRLVGNFDQRYSVKKTMVESAEAVFMVAAASVVARKAFQAELEAARRDLLEIYGHLPDHFHEREVFAADSLRLEVLPIEGLASDFGDPYFARIEEVLWGEAWASRPECREAVVVTLFGTMVSGVWMEAPGRASALIPVDFYRARIDRDRLADLAGRLAADPSPSYRATGNAILFKLGLRHPEKARAYHAALGAMWENRDELVPSFFFENLDGEWAWIFARARPFESDYVPGPKPRNLSGDTDPALLGLEAATWEMRRRLPEYLTAHRAATDPAWVTRSIKYKPNSGDGNPFDEPAGAVLRRLVSMNRGADPAEVAELLSNYGVAAPPEPGGITASSRLLVDRCWDPYEHGGVRFVDGEGFWIQFWIARVADGKIWFTGTRGLSSEFLFAVDPATLETETWPLRYSGGVDVLRPSEIAVSPSWVYFIKWNAPARLPRSLHVAARGSGEARLAEGVFPYLGHTDEQPALAGDTLVIQVVGSDGGRYRGPGSPPVSGVVAIEGFGSPELIVSNRRRPAESPLDGTENYVQEISPLSETETLLQANTGPRQRGEGKRLKRYAYNVSNRTWRHVSEAEFGAYQERRTYVFERGTRSDEWKLPRSSRAVTRIRDDGRALYLKREMPPSALVLQSGQGEPSQLPVTYELPESTRSRPMSADPRLRPDARDADLGLVEDLNTTRPMEVLGSLGGHVVIAPGGGLIEAPCLWFIPETSIWEAIDGSGTGAGSVDPGDLTGD